MSNTMSTLKYAKAYKLYTALTDALKYLKKNKNKI